MQMIFGCTFANSIEPSYVPVKSALFKPIAECGRINRAIIIMGAASRTFPDVKVFLMVRTPTDIWLFGYRKEWIVGRIRGVKFGDYRIITNKAWKKN